MKKAMIGGFLALCAAIGNSAVFLTAGNNMADSWSVPPGRLLCTIRGLGLTPLLLFFCLLLLLGLLIMGREFFRKDKD